MRGPSDRSQIVQLTLLTALLLVYVAVSLRHLTVIPPVYEDEPWQASTGLKLATTGVFGSDVFRGLNGMEHHYYGYMPIHPLLLAATYRLAGFGLWQTRLEPVALGLLTLLLTYALGRRLFGQTVGVVAVALLILSRTAGLTRSQPSGILLMDMARIARYDMVVPVFGLGALHFYLTAAEHRRWWWFAAAGLCAGLAGLSHLYGAFWLVVLCLLAWWDGDGWRALVGLVVGFAAPWILYAGYVLDDWPAWMAQMRSYGARFRLASLSWYWSNLTNEYHRYGPGLGASGPVRPAFWAAFLVVPASLFALAQRASARCAGKPPEAVLAARAIVVPGVVLPILFALLLTMKLANYLVAIAPIVALAAAWGGHTLWHWAGERVERRPVLMALGLAAIAILVEGGARFVALERMAMQTTPYGDFIARVRSSIPAGSRILGLHNYWFGLEDFDYRSFVVPLMLADPSTGAVASPAEALDSVWPDVVLIDPRMRVYMEGKATNGPSSDPISNWLKIRGFSPRFAVDDDTYGRMDIYLREPAGDASSARDELGDASPPIRADGAGGRP